MVRSQDEAHGCVQPAALFGALAKPLPRR